MEFTASDIKELNERIQYQTAFIERLKAEVGKVIIGQHTMLERLLIGMLTNGHILLEGVPGLAKTLTIRSLSQAVQGRFSRIQFTPDLLPADVVGTMIYNQQKNEFMVRKGPIFANFILADEINRAPAKVQSALLEAMQERQVTIGDKTFALEQPFLVLATQNPLEQEGTYPLPEAQQDRFMFKVFVRYPSFEEERQIAKRTTSVQSDEIQTVLDASEILALQRLVRQVPVSDHVVDYALALVRQTRVGEAGIPQFVSDQLSWGAGPRAVQFLLLGGKARALLNGRTYVSTEDIQALAAPVLRHRIVVNFSAESEGITSDQVVEQLIKSTPSKEGELTRDPNLAKIFAA